MEELFENQALETDSLDIKKYFRGLVKRWWLIAGICAVVTVPWFLYVKSEPPNYAADIWVTFENMAGNIPQNVVESRKRYLQSRTFAEEITAKMGLTLQIFDEMGHQVYNRESFFHLFTTTKTQQVGDYKLTFNSNGTTSIRFNNQLMDSVKTERVVLDTFMLNDTKFIINPNVIKEQQEINYKVVPFDQTVASLLSREEVRFDDTGSMMRIALTGPNPVLVSQTVNMLADMFVQGLMQMRQETNSFKRSFLEDQLNLAKQNLDRSDFRVKQFRDSHISGLDNETQLTVNRVTQTEQAIANNASNVEEIQTLLSKLDPQSPDFEGGDATPYIYRQIANLAIFTNDKDMALAKIQIMDLDREKEGYISRGFPAANTNVIEVSGRISEQENKIYSLAEKRIGTLKKELKELETQKETLQKTLNSLPEEEMRLVQLERQRQADEQLYELLLKRWKEAQLSEAVVPESVRIIDRALPPTSPVTGDKKKKAMLGLLVGLFLGVGVCLFLEVMDKSIRTREDIRRFLNLPIMGSIPKVKFDEYEFQDSEKTKNLSSQIVTHDYSPTPVGEAYRVLRTNLLFSKRMTDMKTLLIGSVSPGEGKSFTSANLAITLAQQKSKTLLIDADLRRGVLHNTFSVSKKPGLTNYLTGMMPLNDVIKETYVPNLSLITCGSMIPNPSEILGSMRMQKFIEGISQRFDFIIFDTPPLNAATDAVVLGTLVDGVAVILRAGQTNGIEVQRRLELFENVQSKIVGVILNGAGADVAHDGYSYYKY